MFCSFGGGSVKKWGDKMSRIGGWTKRQETRFFGKITGWEST